MKYYNYKKAIRLMKRYKVKKATLGMLSDWFWTAGEVTIGKLRTLKTGKSTWNGISGSTFDRPTLKISKNGWFRQIDCYLEVVE